MIEIICHGEEIKKKCMNGARARNSCLFTSCFFRPVRYDDCEHSSDVQISKMVDKEKPERTTIADDGPGEDLPFPVRLNSYPS